MKGVLEGAGAIAGAAFLICAFIGSSIKSDSGKPIGWFKPSLIIAAMIFVVFAIVFTLVASGGTL